MLVLFVCLLFCVRVVVFCAFKHTCLCVVVLCCCCDCGVCLVLWLCCVALLFVFLLVCVCVFGVFAGVSLWFVIFALSCCTKKVLPRC